MHVEEGDCRVLMEECFGAPSAPRGKTKYQAVIGAGSATASPGGGWTGDLSLSRGSVVGPRKSPRLASRPGVHVLVFAMARKATLRDDPRPPPAGVGDGGVLGRGRTSLSVDDRCGGYGPSGAAGWSPTVNQRLIELSASCGVVLSEMEACSLACFLGPGSAVV